MIGQKLTYSVARLLEQKGRIGETQTVYNWLLDRPGLLDERVPLNLGKIHMDAGDFDRADRVFAKGISAFPLNAEIHYAKGFNLERQEQWQEAIDCYVQALKNNADTGKLNYRIARCLVHLKQLAEASSHIRAVITTNPDDLRAHKLLVSIVKQTGPSWLEESALDAAIENGAGTSAYHFRLGELASARGDHPKAAAAFESAAKTRNDSSWAWYMSGLSWESSSKIVDAKSAYAEAIKRDKRHESNLYGIGRFHQKRGLWNQAAEAFLDEMADQPDNAILHYHAGNSLERAYRWPEATHQLTIAILLNPAPAIWKYRLAYCFERCENYASASLWYKLALKQMEKPYWRYRLVSTLASQGRYEEATHEFEDPRLSKKMQNDPVILTLTAEMDTHIRATLDTLRTEGFNSRNQQLLRTVAGIAEQYGYGTHARESLSAFARRDSSQSPESFRAAATLLASDGKYEKACNAYLRTRIFRSAHGADTKQFIKNADDRIRMAYIEYHDNLEIDDDCILYESFQGSSISENPLALFRTIHADPTKARLTHIWVVQEDTLIPEELQGIENIIFVERDSLAYVRYLASAKYLINNNTFPPYYVRKSGQKYLNSWHGVPIKTVGTDIKNGQMDHRNATRNFLQSTHLLFPNSHTKDTILRSYGISGIYAGEIINDGYPRIDSSVNLSTDMREKLRHSLGVRAGEKILLYAPTWRGDLQETAVDVDQVLCDLNLMSGLGYHVLFRGHHMSEQVLRSASIETTIVPRSIDTNDLLAIADLLITDYSSIAVDFYSLKKPVIYHAYDYDKYSIDRGLYYDLNELPGTLCTKPSELPALIVRSLSSPEDSIANESDIQIHCPFDDGNSSKRIADMLFSPQLGEVHEVKNNSKISILFYEGPFNSNGITTSFLNLINSLDPDKYVISVAIQPSDILTDESRLTRFNNLPSHVNIIPRIGQELWSSEERWINSQMNLQRQLFSQKQNDIYRNAFKREYQRIFGSALFDVIVNFEGYSRFWAPLLSSGPAGSRSVIYQHNDMVSERNSKYGYLDIVFQSYNYYSSIISVSESVFTLNQVQLSSELNIEEKRFAYCNNLMGATQVIRSAEIPLDPALDEWTSNGSKNIVTIGRLSPEKGHEKLIAAFDKLRVSIPNSQLTIVGEGPLETHLRALVSSLGLESCVRFTGVLSNPFPLISAADLFVLSSEYEGQGLVLLEAMALGVPVVSTDVVGPRSVLAGNRGLLVDNSVDGLAEGMARVLTNGYAPTIQFSAESYDEEAMQSFEKEVLGS